MFYVSVHSSANTVYVHILFKYPVSVTVRRQHRHTQTFYSNCRLKPHKSISYTASAKPKLHENSENVCMSGYTPPDVKAVCIFISKAIVYNFFVKD